MLGGDVKVCLSAVSASNDRYFTLTSVCVHRECAFFS